MTRIQHRPLTSLFFLILAVSTVLVQVVSAAEVFGPSDIAASTTLADSGHGFTIDQICDGIIDPPVWYNGFAAVPGQVGTIRLDLATPRHLYDFVLWNDINVLAEGIGQFRLDFFDAADSFLGSTTTLVGPVGSSAAAVYTFPVMMNVKRVDLVVLTLNPNQRLEIREVGFNESGTVGTAASDWSALKWMFR